MIVFYLNFFDWTSKILCTFFISQLQIWHKLHTFNCMTSFSVWQIIKWNYLMARWWMMSFVVSHVAKRQDQISCCLLFLNYVHSQNLILAWKHISSTPSPLILSYIYKKETTVRPAAMITFLVKICSTFVNIFLANSDHLSELLLKSNR